MRKRFIAGASCPQCNARDTLALWCEDGQEKVACVKCNFEMQAKDKPVLEEVLPKANLIGMFNPD